jgi:hypothetical protein
MTHESKRVDLGGLRRRARMGTNGPEAGAAMLVVMLVLLVVTASATMAVYSTQFEVRATGHQRQAMQTTMVAEAGLVAGTTTIEMVGGARVLRWRMERAPRAVGTRLSAEDPPLGSMNNETERFLSSDLVPGTSPSVRLATTDATGFGLSAFEPRFIVDVNDGYNVLPTFVGQAAGTRVDGNGTVQMQYYVATVTSRGRMVRNGLLDANGGYSGAGVFTPPEAALTGARAHLRRDIFETAATARSVTISGPYSPM